MSKFIFIWNSNTYISTEYNPQFFFPKKRKESIGGYYFRSKWHSGFISVKSNNNNNNNFFKPICNIRCNIQVFVFILLLEQLDKIHKKCWQNTWKTARGFLVSFLFLFLFFVQSINVPGNISVLTINDETK